MAQNISGKIDQLARRNGVLRARDLAEEGLHPETVRRLCQTGAIERVGRGLYTLPNHPVTEHYALTLAAARAPHAVICLLSALRFHEIGTQNPHEVWIALRSGRSTPKIDALAMRVVRFSGRSFEEGRENHILDGVSTSIYCPAKTVADCFKFRNLVGLDVAIEALKDCIRNRRCTIDELFHYAAICRVAGVMRPYAEAVAG